MRELTQAEIEAGASFLSTDHSDDQQEISLVIRDYGHAFTFTIRRKDGPRMSCTVSRGEAARLLKALQDDRL